MTVVDLPLPELMARAMAMSIRRRRVCKHAPACPNCRTRQVQLIRGDVPAQWKCRKCRTKWNYEPIISINEGKVL